MFSYIWSYDIYKSFATQEQAYEAGLKHLGEHPTNGSSMVIIEVKQVMKASLPVTIQNVSLEEFKKDCKCEEPGVQAALSAPSHS